MNMIYLKDNKEDKIIFSMNYKSYKKLKLNLMEVNF